MKDRTTLELAQRLNEIIKLTQSAELERMRLDGILEELEKEWNDICYELWDRIPNLKNDTDIKPHYRVKKPEKRGQDV